MGGMASWEDGPEYAPVERPDEFVSPDVAPLDSPPPRVRLSDAPLERPQFGDPEQPVAALATLTVTDPIAGRDPSAPFDVVSTPLTEGSSAWSAAHWNPPSGDSTPVVPADPGWAPPTGAPAAAPIAPSGPGDTLGSGQRTVLRPPPGSPILLSGRQDPIGSGVDPQPGTPGWFAPPHGPPAGEPVPLTVGRFTAALTPGVIIVLAIGGIVAPLSLVLFILAFVLSARVRIAGRAVRRVFTVASIVLGLSAIGAIFAAADDWWGTVGILSIVTCWVVLLVNSALVLRALQAGERPPPARRNMWG